MMIIYLVNNKSCARLFKYYLLSILNGEKTNFLLKSITTTLIISKFCLLSMKQHCKKKKAFKDKTEQSRIFKKKKRNEYQ